MGKGTSVEIQSNHIIASDVFVVIDRIAEAEGRTQQILEIRVAVKKTRALGDLIVQPAEQVILAERVGEIFRIRLERSGDRHRSLRILRGPLAVEEKERLVLDDGSAQVATVLTALGVRIGPSRQFRGPDAIVAKLPKGFAMDRIAS